MTGGVSEAGRPWDGAETFEVVVNGEQRQVTCRPETPLIYPIRNDWSLKATRLGCGLGQCGACIVLLDGEPTASCSLPIASADGREVTTAEGLLTGGRLSRLQECFIEEQAAQCGYCMSGILMSATALLRRNLRPGRQDIHDALTGNLCRCGSHGRVVRAVLRVAGEQ